jgi:uncharacterized membrane protein YgdD (TMEM256/DUF423 family)
VIAGHVSGVPVEELLPALTGAGGLLLARGWFMLRARGRRKIEG